MAPIPPLTSHKVAVIGAGAAGLVAARELRREGHTVVVFERENRIGGTWVYNPEAEPDPLGFDPNRKPIIHSSLYKSLRTNFPRELMGFRDYPLLYAGEGKGRDLRRYPGHEEVLRHLEGFAEEFGLREMVGFEREVVKVCLAEEKWVVKWRSTNKSNDLEVVNEEVFDAVVVCNGHFTEPRVAQIPGNLCVRTPDPLGFDPNRKPIIHSSLYKSLRTNFPRELMGFRDYPFLYAGEGKGRDLRRYPGHEEVLRHLEGFAEEFGLREMVGFEREVVKVCLAEEKWVVKWRSTNKSNDLEVVNEEVFDAVVVCNGHFTEPRVAQIPGVDVWPGKQIHSHNYRTPEPFKDQVVVLIGSASSAVDISREIAMVAKEVHIASWSFEGPSRKQPGYSNIWLCPMVESVHEDGTVTFRDGSFTNASIILHCTGYKYHFPFLETNGIVTVDDNRVGPLYKHIFPPALAPWLSFVGIPRTVLNLLRCEIQSKCIARVLSGRIELPSQEEMMDDVEKFYYSLEASGIPKRYTHNMSGVQFEYNDWLAEQCGCPPTEEWRKEMYFATSKNKQIRPETYRDEWEDDHLISQAHEDFRKYTSRQDSNGCIS